MKAVLIFASTEWKKGQQSPFAHSIMLPQRKRVILRRKLQTAGTVNKKAAAIRQPRGNEKTAEFSLA